MRGATPPLPHYVFVAWCSVGAQGKNYLPVPQYYTQEQNKIEIKGKDLCDNLGFVFLSSVREEMN
jgi:hypothetical protein